MRAADGISLVQRQGRLPVPPRPHQRRQTRPGPGGNAYVREDRILPQLPAVYLLLTGADPGARRRRRTRRGMDVPPPASAEDVIGYLREHGITLTWDPAAATLQASATEPIKTATGKQANPGLDEPRTGRRKKGTAGRPALAGARARVTSRHARKRPAMGFNVSEGGSTPYPHIAL